MIFRIPVVARWLVALVVLGSLSVDGARAAEPVTGGVQGTLVTRAKGKFHLYLLIGQSNMAGRGAVEEADKKPLPRVFMFTKEKAWAPAVDPQHFDKPIAG